MRLYLLIFLHFSTVYALNLFGLLEKIKTLQGTLSDHAELENKINNLR